jgi:hypothetical protein
MNKKIRSGLIGALILGVAITISNVATGWPAPESILGALMVGFVAGLFIYGLIIED